jgi:hypothetical protein
LPLRDSRCQSMSFGLEAYESNGRRFGFCRAYLVCSNRAATRVNLLKTRAKCSRKKIAICRCFASSRTLQQTIVPPLHGGGQGFESPRLHSRNFVFVIIAKHNLLFGWGCALVHDSSLSSHSANSSTGSTSSVRSPRPCYISPRSTWPRIN